jgi:ribosomal protein L31E
MQNLYNRRLKWYPWFDQCNQTVKPIVLTNHAKRKIVERNGTVQIDHIVNGTVIEVLADNITKKIEKFVVRHPHDTTHDIIYAIANEDNAWVVKTVWLNENTDHHDTLTTKGYVIA